MSMRGVRWIHKTLIALTALGILTGAAPATYADPVSVGEWAHEIWTSAQQGRSGDALELLRRVPANHPNASVRNIHDLVERRAGNIEKFSTQRLERLKEIETEIDEEIQSGDLDEALVKAVEAKTLLDAGHDRAPQALAEAIDRIVTLGERKAHEAERAGRWLEAHELFFRLHLLFETEETYKEDVERVGRRLMMMRLYTPERLHDMRSQARVAEGEEPLPPFNEMGEDWRQKLEGISQSMLIRALNTAQRAQVDGADMARMLIGGLQAVRTMATTPDLADAFPGLADLAARSRFVEAIDVEINGLKSKKGRASYFDLTRTLDRVQRANRYSVRVEKIALFHEFGNGAMEQLDDYSNIIWPDELRRFERSTRGKFTGVGIQISLDDAMQLQVVTPLEGTPAHRAGIRRGDIVREVDSESTLGISLSQAVDRITGEEGTTVTLTVEREDEPEWISFDIKRAVIPIHSVKGWERDGPRETDWDWFIDDEGGIGYVRLTQFTEDTTRELVDALREMRREELNGLILDLRFNPGGLLNAAVGIANLFIDEGVIVSQHDASGAVRDAQRARPGFVMAGDLPVVVLLNEGSASASEIVAGALQDYDKAVLVGARSFGKGSVQNVYPLSGGAAALKLTTQYYRLPGGRLIHRRPGREDYGVAPDIEVTMLPSQTRESLQVRMDADLMPLDDEGVAEDEAQEDPQRLLDEGLDPQLETALLLLQSQALPTDTRRAMLEPPAPAGAPGAGS